MPLCTNSVILSRLASVRARSFMAHSLRLLLYNRYQRQDHDVARNLSLLVEDGQP
jgi:hypothetical protein